MKPAQQSFNPRTREGATRKNTKVTGNTIVSIHAPVRVRLRTVAREQAKNWFQSTHP
uniref:Uncharacterized protein n=1 Tax=Siphoviridae sp. ctpnN3 TaxID=2825677 RepID=A0A8S5QDK8_9CAUD|nr:MAG TPA: hypothetical protein [Siphoviridae sp. ctpnN3]